MSEKPALVVDFCSHEAAKDAVMHWHYSKRMPKSKLVKVGAWEEGQFIGAVIFGYGATPEIGSPYGLIQTEICELVRVALTHHFNTTSSILTQAIRKLKGVAPGLRLIVSFADSEQQHHGGLYQATNWIYSGNENYHVYRVNDEIVHPRTLYDRYGVGGQSIAWLHEHIDENAERIHTAIKYKYLMPLDKKMRKQVELLRQPYPKPDTNLSERLGGAGERDSAPQSNEGTGGASPTAPL